MPAVTEAQLKAAIKDALVAKFKKRDEDGNEVSGELPESMQDMVDGIAKGVAKAWSDWQTAQLVSGTCAAPGNPLVVGTAGKFLP